MKIPGVLLLALLSPLAVRAQLLWDAAMGTAAFDETSVTFLAVPGGHLNVGQGGRDGKGTQSDQIYLAKVDDAGTVLWQKGQALRSFPVLYPNGAAADAQGQCYVAATGFDKANTVYQSHGVLIKYSAAGDTLWTRRIKQAGAFAAFGPVLTTDDGGAVVIGSQGLDAFIAKYAGSGQLLWRRTYLYSSEHPGYLQQLTKLATGFLVVDSPNYGSIPPKYLILDNEGRLLAEKPAPPYYPYSLQPDLAGNILSAAGRLSKISPQGDSLWTRKYQLYGGPFEVVAAAATTGNRYLLAGTRFDGASRNLGLLLTDQNGNRLRDTLLLRSGSDVFLSGVFFDQQGNYLLGGSATNGPIGGVDQFALLLRKWDRLLAAVPAQVAPGAYTVFPNPATSDYVRVSTGSGQSFMGDFQLYSSTGQVLCTGRAVAAGIDLREVAPGLYLLRLRKADHWLPAIRLVRQ